MLFVGGVRAPLTLLSCSEQRFGTKNDVTPLIKPAYRSISFIIWAFPGVASNIPDTIQSNFTTPQSQQTRGVDPMMAAAEDAVPTYKQHWVNLLSTHLLVKELTSH